MTRQNKSQTSGFTLIELLLAMTFFTSILLVSTAVVVQIIGIYSKGIVVKQMNSVGRTLTDDLIRTGNNSKGLEIERYGASDRIRCLKVGSSVYIWGYSDDLPSGGSLSNEAFRINDTAPVNLSRYTTVSECPLDPTEEIPSSSLEPLLSNNSRVYVAEAVDRGAGLLQLRLVIGTYTPLLTELNPAVTAAPDGATVSCPTGSVGNFCAFSSYETVLYLPN